MAKVPDHMTEGTCGSEKCGRRILWARVQLESGEIKKLPFDKRRQRVYTAGPDGVFRASSLGFLPHHRTCPGVEDFNKRKRGSSS